MIQPLRDFVTVSKDEATQTSKGGIIISHIDEKIIRGTVLAVGSGRVCADGTIIPLEVKVGDKIAFNKNFATEISGGGETVLILREDQIYCKVSEK